MGEFKRGSVNKEAKSKDLVPIEPSHEKPFWLVKLVEVRAAEYEKKDSKAKFKVLEFVFKDGTDDRTHIEKVWPIVKELEGKNRTFSVSEQVEWQDNFLTHIYNTFAGNDGAAALLNGGSGMGATTKVAETTEESWDNFFEQVAEDFQKGRDGKPIFNHADGKPVIVWIKLLYDKKGNINMPLFGNSLDPYKKDKPTLLTHKKGEVYWKKPAGAMEETTTDTHHPEVKDEDVPEGFM